MVRALGSPPLVINKCCDVIRRVEVSVRKEVDWEVVILYRPPIGVNGGEKMYRRGGVNLHNRFVGNDPRVGGPCGPTGASGELIRTSVVSTRPR